MRAGGLLAAVAALSTGCDAVFGLERPATEDVIVNVARRYLFNDGNFTSTYRDLGFTMEELPSVEAFTEAGERLEVELTYPVTSIVIRRPRGVGYRVVLRIAEADSPIELQSDLPVLTFREDVFHRPDAARTASFTDLHGTISPAGANRLSTTGVISQIELGDGGAYLARPAYMLDSTLNDRAYFARYGVVSSVWTMTQFAEVDIRMAVGPNLRDVVLETTNPGYCVHIIAQTIDELARVTALYPTYTMLDQTVWQILASPSSEIRPGVLLPIAYQAIAGSDLDVPYSVPFRGYTTLLHMGVQRARKVNDVLTLFVGTTSFWRFPDDSECAQRTLEAGTVAMPGTVRLAGIPLDSDGVEVRIDAPTIVEYEAEGPADQFGLRLDDVTTGERRLRTYFGATPRFVIDPDLLVPGHTYAFQTFVARGHPNVADGDFASVAYPYASGYGHSSLFTVAN